jgi:hypothetical protein
MYGDSRLKPDSTHKSYAAARDEAASRGGGWVYRTDPAARRPGRLFRRDKELDSARIEGGVYVYGDGTELPIAIVNEDPIAWRDKTPPPASRLRVGTSLAGGTAAVFGAAELVNGVVLPHIDLHIPGTTLTWTIVGSALRGSIKFLRYLQAAKWERMNQDMKSPEALENKWDFETQLNELNRMGQQIRGLHSTQRPGTALRLAGSDFAYAVKEIWLQGGRERSARAAKRELRANLGNLSIFAKQLGIDEARVDDLIAGLEAGIDSKVRFDADLRRHAGIIDRLGRRSARNFLAGISKSDRGDLSSQLKVFEGALDRLRDTDPSNDQAAMESMGAALGELRIAPNLRSTKSGIRRSIDLLQFSTYGLSLGYVLHDGIVPQNIHDPRMAVSGAILTALLATGNAADGIGIVGKRLGTVARLGKHEFPSAAPTVAGHPIFANILPGFDSTSTLLAAADTGIRVFLDQGLSPYAQGVHITLVEGYTVAVLRNWWPEAKRGFGDPDEIGRSRFLLGKWSTAAGGLGLAVDSVARAIKVLK